MIKQATAASALTLMLVTSQVAATPYSNIYVFGDSLYDSGQFGLRATNRVGPDFENSPSGPVSPDLIAIGLGLPPALPSRQGGTNYAVGGNRSLDTLNSVAAATTYESSIGINNPQLDVEFNSLFYDLQRNGQAFDPNALYLLDGGGNDIGAGTVLNDASAGVVATNMVNAAHALTDRGARYVIITNIPDFGLAPAGVDFATFASTMAASVNRQIAEQVGNDNILIFDAYSMLQEMVADPASYGINLSSHDISRACFDSQNRNCLAGDQGAKIDGANPDPNQFFFNDPLHPTTIGQQISADYLLSVLRAPGEIALLPALAGNDLQAHWRSAQPALLGNRWNTNANRGWQLWGGGAAQQHDMDTAYGDSGDSQIDQFSLGVAMRPADNWYLGGQISRGDNTLSLDHSGSEYAMRSVLLSLLAGTSGERWFANGVLSYGDLDYHDLERRFSLGPVKRRTELASTEGSLWGAQLNAGYNLLNPGSPLRLGPSVSLEHQDISVDGYSERAGNATALRVWDQDLSTTAVAGGVFADWALQICQCRLTGAANYRVETDSDDNNPRLGLVSVAGNSAVLPSGYQADDDYWRWELGLEAGLGQQLKLTLNANGDSADDSQGWWYGANLLYQF